MFSPRRLIVFFSLLLVGILIDGSMLHVFADDVETVIEAQTDEVAGLVVIELEIDVSDLDLNRTSLSYSGCTWYPTECHWECSDWECTFGHWKLHKCWMMPNQIPCAPHWGVIDRSCSCS